MLPNLTPSAAGEDNIPKLPLEVAKRQGVDSDLFQIYSKITHDYASARIENQCAQNAKLRAHFEQILNTKNKVIFTGAKKRIVGNGF